MRRANPGDAEAIARIHVDAYETSLGAVVDRAVLDAGNAARRPMWVRLLATPPDDQAVFVVDESGSVRGFVSAGPDRDPASESHVGEIYALFVDPSHWLAGIGSELLDAGVEHLRSLHLIEARLWVLDMNDRARRFYRARGWSDLGIVREDERGRFLRYGRQT